MFTILQWAYTTSVISKWGTFSPFLSSFILPLVLLSNFTISGVKCSREGLILILNVILFSILFTYIFTEGSPVTALYFLMVYSKYSWISDTEYDLLWHVIQTLD